MNGRIASWIVTLLLALAMAAGAVVHGLALATPPRDAVAAQAIVICAAGVGERVILVDSHGNPVDPTDPCPALPCPDCLPAANLALIAAPVVVGGHVLSAAGTLGPSSFATLPDRRLSHDAARGPPAEV